MKWRRASNWRVSTSPASARSAARTTGRMRPPPTRWRARKGSPPLPSRQGLKSFAGLAHRMEQVARRGKVLFVNDSKATNADAAGKALASFTDIYWIIGGRPKEGGLAGLEPFFPKIARAYLIGEAAEAFARQLGGRCRSCALRHARSRRRGGGGRCRAVPPPGSLSCCFRPLAPLTISSTISPSAATPFGKWSWASTAPKG